jgi:uncharacterized protein YbjT (DUF2867 family)
MQGQLNLVAAAKANGVERFVFVSYCYDRDNLYPLSNAKQAVERAIEELNYTILRASYFMEIWLSPLVGFDYPNAKARTLGAGLRQARAGSAGSRWLTCRRASLNSNGS